MIGRLHPAECPCGSGLICSAERTGKFTVRYDCDNCEGRFMSDNIEGDSTYQTALDHQERDRQKRVSAEGPLDREVQSRPRLLPGAVPPDAHATTLERLIEAMCMAASVNRDFADAYAMAFKVAVVAAPFGDHGPTVERLLKGLTKRLAAHLATIPNCHPT